MGLSDDAGGANPLGFATSQAFAPQQSAVNHVDDYIEFTLYGIKNDTAKPPLKSLQLPEPNNGVRMTMYYYNQSYFPYNYTEADECGVAGGQSLHPILTQPSPNPHPILTRSLWTRRAQLQLVYD